MTIKLKRVEVYRNLHKNCFSVRSLEGDDKGLVIAHVQSISLENVKFVVQPAGRKRVLKDKRKNVHAFLRGTITCNGTLETNLSVEYDPYLNEGFIANNKIIKKASLARLSFDNGHSKILASSI